MTNVVISHLNTKNGHILPTFDIFSPDHVFFYFKKNKASVGTDGLFLRLPLSHFPFPRGATQECPAEEVDGLNPAIYSGVGLHLLQGVVLNFFNFKHLYKGTTGANKTHVLLLSLLLFSIQISLFLLYIYIHNKYVILYLIKFTIIIHNYINNIVSIYIDA